MYFLEIKSEISPYKISSISRLSVRPNLDMYFCIKNVATLSQWRPN